jgi:MFS family permease
MLFVMFLITSTSVTGASVHLVPLLTDSGLTARQAVPIAGSLGVALIGGRVLAGYLMDRFFAPYVAMALFILSGCGMLVLTTHLSIPTAVLGAVLVGVGVGAEFDVMSYLSSRYFGLSSFAQIYGYQFVGFTMGTALGPWLMGHTFDHRGTYRPTLLLFAGLIALSAVLLSRLGPYPLLPEQPSIEPSR